MGEFTGVLAAVGIVVGFGLFASLPVIAVTMVQNSSRRRFTQEVADRFGLEADMDSGTRFKRARPLARGTVGKQLVDVRTGISRSTYLKASGAGFLRTDLCIVTVFAGRHLTPFVIGTSVKTPGNIDDFHAAFSIKAEGNSVELDPDLKLKLLGIRREFFRVFEIAVDEDGRMKSTTAPLLTRRTSEGVKELVAAMLLMGETL